MAAGRTEVLVGAFRDWSTEQCGVPKAFLAVFLGQEHCSLEQEAQQERWMIEGAVFCVFF